MVQWSILYKLSIVHDYSLDAEFLLYSIKMSLQKSLGMLIEAPAEI